MPPRVSHRYCWLDATQTATLVTSNDTATGYTYVTRWNDRDGGSVYADRPTESSGWLGNTPRLLANRSPTGLSMVDFGTGDATPAPAGGAWFKMRPNGNAYVREAFMVYRATANIWGNHFDTLSYSMINNAYIGTKTTLVSQEYAYQDGCTAAWTVDGAAENPWYLRKALGSGADSELHILHVASARNLQIDLLCNDRGNKNSGLGSKQIGEIIFYDRSLTEDERRQTEAYLLKRWKDAAHPGEQAVIYDFAGEDMPLAFDNDADVTVNALNGYNPVIVKTGSGATTLTNTLATADGHAPGGSVTVDTGTLNLCYDYPILPLYGFDASKADSFSETYVSEGRTYFKKWTDGYGSGHTAKSLIGGTPKSGMTNGYLTVEETAPGVTRTLAHFGTGQGNNGTGTDSAGMRLDAEFSVREVFAFETDVAGSQSYNTLFGGHYKYYPFLRAWNPNGALFQNYDATTAPAVNGYIAVNGEVKDHTFVPTAGTYYLFNFCPTSNVAIYNIANDRNLTAGGLKIGEQLAFGVELATNRRAAVTATLLNKWKGVGAKALWTNDLGDVTLTRGGAVTLQATDAFATPVYRPTSLTGYGTITALGSALVGITNLATEATLGLTGDVALAPDAVITTHHNGGTAAITVSGTLALPETGTVVFDAERAPYADTRGYFPVITAAAVTGPDTLENWRADVRNARSKADWRVTADEKGLYLMYLRPGSVIYIR